MDSGPNASGLSRIDIEHILNQGAVSVWKAAWRMKADRRLGLHEEAGCLLSIHYVGSMVGSGVGVLRDTDGYAYGTAVRMTALHED